MQRFHYLSDQFYGLKESFPVIGKHLRDWGKCSHIGGADAHSIGHYSPVMHEDSRMMCDHDPAVDEYLRITGSDSPITGKSVRTMRHHSRAMRKSLRFARKSDFLSGNRIFSLNTCFRNH